MTAIVSWSEGVMSLAQPPVVSECSVLGDAVGSGLLFPNSSFPYYRWLKKPLQEDVWRDGVAICADASQHDGHLVIIPGYMVEFESFEPS